MAGTNVAIAHHPQNLWPERPVRDLLSDDLKHMVQGTGGRWRQVAETTVKTIVHPRIRAVVLFRLSQVMVNRKLVPLAYALQSRAIRSSGAEINPFAHIDAGLCLMHSVGIVIGPEVRIGRNVRIYQGVTLGDGSRPGQPTIGDDVVIGAGAAILGGVTIGDRVFIGANAVVTHDVPDDSVATGAPAVWRRRR